MKVVKSKHLLIGWGALLLWASCTALASRVDLVWDRPFVDGTNQVPQAIIRTSDGGYAVAGYGSVELVRGGIGAEIGFWTVKFDRNGNLQWQRALAADPPKRREEGSTLAETRDGGILVAGMTGSDSLAGEPLGETPDPKSPLRSQIGFAIKYASDGTLLWKKALRSKVEKPFDRFFAVACVEDGCILSGKTNVIHTDEAAPKGQRLIWVLRVLKLSDSGEVLWDRTVLEGDLTIIANSISRKIVTTRDRGFVVATGPGDRPLYRKSREMDVVSESGKVLGKAPFQQIVVLKFDRDGQVVKRAAFPAATEILALGSNRDGYIVAGYAHMLWYAFLDEDLNLKWRRAVIQANPINAFYGASDGGFYAAGSKSQVAVLYISPSGELTQQGISGTPADSAAEDIAPGENPDEFVLLWSRIVRTRAGVMKFRIPSK